MTLDIGKYRDEISYEELFEKPGFFEGMLFRRSGAGQVVSGCIEYENDPMRDFMFLRVMFDSTYWTGR